MCFGISSGFSHCMACCSFSWLISFWWASAQRGASGYLLAMAVVIGGGVAGEICSGGGCEYLVWNAVASVTAGSSCGW